MSLPSLFSKLQIEMVCAKFTFSYQGTYKTKTFRLSIFIALNDTANKISCSHFSVTALGRAKGKQIVMIY